MTREATEEGASDDSAASFPTCSSCGAPVTIVTVNEPLEGVASPCGCRLVPGTIEFE